MVVKNNILINSLSDEYKKALIWLNKNLKPIEQMNSIEQIILFNLWVVSYYIFRYCDDDVLLYKYTNKIPEFIEFVNDINKINLLHPHFIYNRLYTNFNDNNFNGDDYEFCLNLLRKKHFDNHYFEIVTMVLKDKMYYKTEFNIKNWIVKKHLIKTI